MQNLTISRTWNGISLEKAEQVDLTLGASGSDLCVTVDSPFYGDPAPPGPPGPYPGLWDYEVVELFIVGDGEKGPIYTEIELSPHGHYLTLRLAGIRQVVEQALPLNYTAAIGSSAAGLSSLGRGASAGRRWHGEALVPRLFLPPPPHRLNAFAIHGLGTARRYLAMVPVPGSGPKDMGPDFHRLEHFPPWVLP